MRLIDADRLKEVFRRNTGHDYSELIDIQPTVDVLDKIREEIDEIPLSKPMVSADGLYCYGTKSISLGYFREKVLEIIDKYRGGSNYGHTRMD